MARGRFDEAEGRVRGGAARSPTRSGRTPRRRSSSPGSPRSPTAPATVHGALTTLDEASAAADRYGVPDSRAFVRLLRRPHRPGRRGRRPARASCATRSREQARRGHPAAAVHGGAELARRDGRRPPSRARSTACRCWPTRCGEAMDGAVRRRGRLAALVDGAAVLLAELGDLPRAVRLLGRRRRAGAAAIRARARSACEARARRRPPARDRPGRRALRGRAATPGARPCDDRGPTARARPRGRARPIRSAASGAAGGWMLRRSELRLRPVRERDRRRTGAVRLDDQPDVLRPARFTCTGTAGSPPSTSAGPPQPDPVARRRRSAPCRGPASGRRRRPSRRTRCSARLRSMVTEERPCTVTPCAYRGAAIDMP